MVACFDASCHTVGKDNAEKVSQDTSKLAVAIEALAKVAEQRKQHQSTSSGAEKEAAAIDEDNLCTICYTFPIDRIFAPCRHLSCHMYVSQSASAHLSKGLEGCIVYSVPLVLALV